MSEDNTSVDKTLFLYDTYVVNSFTSYNTYIYNILHPSKCQNKIFKKTKKTSVNVY